MPFGQEHVRSPHHFNAVGGTVEAEPNQAGARADSGNDYLLVDKKVDTSMR